MIEQEKYLVGAILIAVFVFAGFALGMGICGLAYNAKVIVYNFKTTEEMKVLYYDGKYYKVDWTPIRVVEVVKEMESK